MEDINSIKARIQNGETIQLSSGFTSAGVFIGIGLGLLVAFVMLPSILNNPEGIHGRMILALILMLVLMAMVIFQSLYAASGHLQGKQLTLKKVLGGTTEVQVQQVEKISYFALKSTRYTLLKYVDNNGIRGTALLMNSNSMLFGRDVPAGEVIELARSI